MKVSIFIKMRFKGNPRGAGEAAAVIEYIDKEGQAHIRDHRIVQQNNTKNALALKICIHAIRTIIKPCEITIFIDNEYIKNACKNGWLSNWKQYDWKNAKGKEVANAEEWKQMYMLLQMHRIKCEKYKGKYEEALQNKLAKGAENEK